MKNRWFNYRPLCFIFAFLLFGSIFAFYVNGYLAVSLIVAAIILVLIVLVAILKRKINYFLVPVIAFAVGAGMFSLAIFNFNQSIEEPPAVIEARLYRVEKATQSYTRVYADSVKFNDASAKCNLIIYIYDSASLYENIEIGSRISFEPSNFRKTDLMFGDTPSAGFYADNLKYTASADIEDITLIEIDKTFAELVREKVKKNLSIGLFDENLEYSYSSLFGDKDMLDENLYASFKLSGIAHLLAVSGLHVSIICAILYKILDLLKVKRWARLSIVAAFLLFYCYLCGFSVSIIRASIMTIFALLAPLLFREYDSLSAISFAGIIIFLINPLTAFDLSFLLSFACVVGIMMLYKPIKNVVSKTKLPGAIADGFSLSLSTTVALMFIMAFYFRNLNIISLLANIILIPIFTFAFVIIFVVAIISLICPYITYVLYPVNYILNFISLVANVLGNLPIANFATISIPYLAMFAYFALLFLFGRLCTAKRQYKILISIPIVAILVALML